MLLIDSTDDQHGHQHLNIGDEGGVAGKQWFDGIRPIRDDDQIYPRPRNIDARESIRDFIYLGNE
jgi:hypothetical protein